MKDLGFAGLGYEWRKLLVSLSDSLSSSFKLLYLLGKSGGELLSLGSKLFLTRPTLIKRVSPDKYEEVTHQVNHYRF